MPGLYNRAGIMTPPAIFGFLLGSRTIITGSGNTNYTPPRYAKYLYFQLQGAGGGGKNCANSTAGQIILGSGGASGGYAEVLVMSFRSTIIIAIGAGGSGTSGAAGGSSSIASPTNGSSGVGAFILATVTGGTGGGTLATGVSQAFVGPINGSGASSVIGMGQNGRTSYEGYRDSGTVARSGKGADSYFGAGGRAIIAHGVGNNGGAGAGGSGGMSVNAGGAVNGGNGGNGMCIVWEYF